MNQVALKKSERRTFRPDRLKDSMGAIPTSVRILDGSLAAQMIQERQEMGLDGHDEVWEGVYIVSPLANLRHQGIVTALAGILYTLIDLEHRGRALAGANVSDRRQDWEQNFRVPDVVVVLHGGRAVDCETHWFGGPDFLIEIQSPGDETEQKIPFYSQIQVRELLVIQRDSRQLRLYRHDGKCLVPIRPSTFQGGKWLVSDIVPLAFKRRLVKGEAKTELCRTDGPSGDWIV